jgi:hypothetical protein
VELTMTWKSPDPPEWVVNLNGHALAVGGARELVSLDPEELQTSARRSTGVADFGGDTWRPHFEVFIEALEHDATLSTTGRLMARTEVLRALRQRLLLTELWRQDPTILDEPIEAPVFVIGTGRAGTSILHELLALEPTNRVPLTWELLHAGETLGPDADTARRAGNATHSFWAQVQPEFATMHHNDGDEPNECIFATMLEFLSDQWAGTYEVPTYSNYMLAQDHTEAYRYHRRVLQTLQRRDRRERWVLKAPSHLAQMHTLFEVYPDARVIQIHRDPLKSVPSTISLMATLRSMRYEEVDIESIVPFISLGYGLLLDSVMDDRDNGRLPDGQFVDVRYADLMSDPVETLDDVYRAIDVEPPADLAARVTTHLSVRPKDVRGAHRYALADTGLDEVAERARFERYAARYSVPIEA